MKVSAKILKKGDGPLSVAEALGLIVAFGSFTATVIFGILDAVKKTKK